MNHLTLADIKLALRDQRFKDNLPESFKEDLKKWERNPGCGCNIPFYKKIIEDAKDLLKQYFPDKDISDIEVQKLHENNFSVINCSIQDLEEILKKTNPGRKQIAIARYEDQVTVILNEIEPT
jgi:hypothetical protein